MRSTRSTCALAFIALLAVLSSSTLAAAERIPPSPPRFFNDYAGTVSPATAGQLNAQLEQYERASSNQLLVAIYPKMESDSSVEDYTVRVAQAWQVGQKSRSNGAVLFVFKNDRKLYIQVGYGLEAVLTDATCNQIIDNELKPRFRAGNFDGGLRAAVSAMIASTKGEYHGTGRTQADSRSAKRFPVALFAVGFIIFVIFSIIRSQQRGVVYPGRRRQGLAGALWALSNSGSGGSSSSGGSSWGGGGGGGGFSGGGGSFGGGGAGGSW